MSETLTPERWRRLNELLDRALDLAPEVRAGFLSGLKDGEADLRGELEELLSGYEQARTFLEEPVEGYAAPLLREPPGSDSLEGSRVGPYRLLRRIGQGGAGSVYLAARDDEQYKKKVAVKLIRRGLDSDDPRRRFLVERQILARLEHPGIARLLDGGVTGDGRPYLVMELVRGSPLDLYCDRERLGVRRRLELFLEVCGAVAYAHRNLVVHRDLKPGNVLVAEDGAVKLLDFGIAKLLSDEDVTAGLTRTGVRLMTPEYAAPEQVRGETVTTATDVYALGVVLYRLLTGSRPYPAAGDSRHEIERAVLETEPRRPSAAAPRRLGADLDAIVLKALRKEPERRYGSVEALAADVRAHLEGRPVAARKGALWHRAAKFVRRNRLGVAAAAALAALLVGWVVTLEVQSRRIREERDRAERLAAVLPELFWGLEPGELQAAAVSPQEMLDRGLERIDQRLAGEPAIRARVLTLAADVYMRMGDFAKGEETAREALAIRRGLGDESSSEAAENLTLLAQAIGRQGRYAEAEPLHREAVRIRRAVLGAEHPGLAESLHYYAMLLDTTGDREGAETKYREALAIRRATLGDSRDTAHTLGNLAVLLYEQQRYDEAEPYAAEALEMRRRLLGPDHPDVGHSYYVMGGLAEARGELERAAELHRASVELNRRAKGPDHAHVAHGLRALGRVRSKQGRSEEAVAALRQALEIFRTAHGEDHQMTARARHRLGLALMEAGRTEEGERLARRGYEDLRKALGDDHPLVREARAELAAERSPP